ncbi:myelin and lymphocyte protein-like, partial [Tachysurus ichikawai]
MAAATAQTMANLPSGVGICTTAPEIFYLPEL